MTPRSRTASSRTPRALALAGFALALALGSCAGGEAPRVRVTNTSRTVLEGVWVVAGADSVRVPVLAPGRTADVRVPVRGPSRLRLGGSAHGRALGAHEALYVEGSGGYRFRALVDSSGAVTLRFVRLALR
ncbi:MAG: hypothetical protein ACKO3S_06030 [bacterium]